ncbi:MAG TPA: hypothetical protein VHQ47_12720 [Phycisphaerae bacterium]|nr:hypothetical protein [Phycisphaerae bacterium]
MMRRNPIAIFLPLLIGIAAGIACLIAALNPATRTDFFVAYLFACWFWLGISLGALVMPMLHTLTGGEWGRAVRRIGEAASLVTPLMLILWIPLAFGLPHLFVWANPDIVAKETVLQHRTPYLNVPFFLLRTAGYFAIWIALVFIQFTLSRKVERTGNEHTRSALRGWSAAGLIIYLMTMTHASYDWLMSRDIDFYSTTYGFVITTGQTLAGLAFITLILAFVGRHEKPHPLALSTKRGILIDVGNILLTLVILWTYVTFMQLLVIWMGNTGEDNNYFLQRGLGQPSPWRWIGLAIILLHFFVPFFLLLFRGAKGYLPALTSIAAVLFLIHFVEVFWLIAPSGEHKGPVFHLAWVDFVAPVAVGGLWLALFFFLLPERLAAAAAAINNPPPAESEVAHA